MLHRLKKILLVRFALAVAGLAFSLSFGAIASAHANVRLQGAQPLDKLGRAVIGGDVNGDGQDDLIVLSGGASPLGRQGVGVINIFWGGHQLSGIVDLATYLGPMSRVIPSTGDHGDFSYLSCGDFNGDGYADIFHGVPCQQPANCKGKGYLIFGGPSFPDSVDLENPTVDVTTVLGDLWADGWFGLRSAIGDINGDGYDDVVSSAPYFDDLYLGAARIYVIFGAPVLPGTIDLNAEPGGVLTIIEPEFGWESGTDVACGDVNSDGYDDILIGSPGFNPGKLHGKATIVYGAPALPDTMILAGDLPGSKRFYTDPNSEGRFGVEVEFGDIDNDGALDAIIAANNECSVSACGVVSIIYSVDALPDSIYVPDPNLLVTRLAGGPSEHAGGVVKVADVNGDGRDDVIVYREFIDTNDVNKVTVVSGGTALADTIWLADDPSVTTYLGEVFDDNFGQSIAALDWDNDTVADLVVGAARADPLGRQSAGEVLFLSDVQTGIDNAGSLPFELSTNYPNPFNPTTTIAYSIAKNSRVELRIYNVRGQLVKTLVDEGQVPNVYRVPWGGRNNSGNPVASGVYFYRLVAGDFAATKKMVLIR